MNDGWIKLYRQISTNEIFRHDRTAWHVFEVLLISCDKKTGEWSGGRFQLADLCNENPATTYKALKRLEKAKMVTLSSNTKYTTIYICKWSDYQDVGNTKREQRSNNAVTTGEHSNKKENKNTLYKYKVSDPVLLETLNDYELHRKKLKRPMSDKAKQLLLNKLEKLYPDNTEKQVEALNQSIENGWLSVFEIKEDSTAIKEYN